LSEFHFVRTLGDQGGVEAVDGPAVGIDLESLLQDGLPPFKVALEIVAGLCEILDIAREDEEVHGDINGSNVFLDETGAISIEGFGVERKKTPAPEKRPRGSVTDLYGLGRIIFSLLCSRKIGELPEDADGHDNEIIDATVAVNFGELPEAMIGDIQWFLVKLQAFDREDRPAPLDTWRSFIAFAGEVDGPFLFQWMADAIEGGGLRRSAEDAQGDTSESEEKEITEDEDSVEELGGPVVSSGPLSKGAISFGGGATKSGQMTAFWTRDQMKAAMEADEEEEEEGFKPAVGGGGATGFWSSEQMKAMADGDQQAPRPKRVGSSGQRSIARTPNIPAPKGSLRPPTLPPQQGLGRADTLPPPQEAAPKKAPLKPPAKPKQKSPVARQSATPKPASPVARQSATPKPTAPVAAVAARRTVTDRATATPLPQEQGGKKTLWVALGAAFFLFVCLGGPLVVGGGLWSQGFFESSAKETPAAVVEKEAPEPEVKDTGTAEPTPKPKSKPKPKPKPRAKPKPKPAPKPASSTRPRSSSSVRPSSSAPPPEPAPAAGPAMITFSSPEPGKLTCGSKRVPFDGDSVKVSFESYQLPANCLVAIGGVMEVFQVTGSGNVRCTKAGKTISCTGP